MVYSREKSSLERQKNIGKIGRMSVAEVSKDPHSSINVLSTRGFDRVKNT
jgi:hypothetical protein